MTGPKKKVWRRMACCCPPASEGNYVLDPACLAHVGEARLRDSFVQLEAENARLREKVRMLEEVLEREEPHDYIDAEDMVLMQVQAIRRKQRANYSAQHDRRHEPWEWLGLIASYAAAARFADAAALCVAAALAAVKETDDD